MQTVFIPVVLIALSQIASSTDEPASPQQPPAATESSPPKQERSVLIAPPDDYFSRKAKTARLQQPRLFNQPADAAPLQPDLSTPLSLQDRSIAPASAASNLAPVPADTTTARRLLKTALQQHPSSTLSGKKTTLLEALRKTSPSNPSAVIKAYWSLCGAIAHHRYAIEEVEFWNDFTPALDPAERAITTALRATAEADRLDTQRRAVAAQYHLAELTGQAKTDLPPLPQDAPLLGAYNTNFSAMFADRQPPTGLAEIAHTLPLSQQTIAARADAVILGQDALAAMSDAYVNGLTSIEGVAASITRLRKNRLQFLEATIQYNLQIAQYSLAAIDSNLSPDQLVTTLIETEPRIRSALLEPGKVRTVSGQQEQPPQTPNSSPAQKAGSAAFRDVTPPRSPATTKKAPLVPVLPLTPDNKTEQR